MRKEERGVSNGEMREWRMREEKLKRRRIFGSINK